MGMQSAAAAAKFSYLSPFISLTLSEVLTPEIYTLHQVYLYKVVHKNLTTLSSSSAIIITHQLDGLHNPHPADCQS